VIITGRREHRLAEVAALDPVIVPVRADVTTEDGAEAVATAVAARSGKLDVLVHNAGVYRMTPIDGFDIALAREMLETNVVGPVLLTTRLLPMLRSSSCPVWPGTIPSHRRRCTRRARRDCTV
jgi:NAD(P)-dependent dehydrogenase (short-subunit alcohol dehydrogenase family)